MPQKKNPWALAWIRGEGALALGRLSGVFTLMKAESDQLEATELAAWEFWPMLEVVDDAAQMLTGMITGAQFDTARLYALAAAQFCQGTDLAAILVTEAGLPWREAHQLTARIVREAVTKGIKPLDVTPDLVDRLRAEGGLPPIGIDADVLHNALDPRHAIQARDAVTGSPAPRQVRMQIEEAAAQIRDDEVKAEHCRADEAAASVLLEQAIDELLSGSAP